MEDDAEGRDALASVERAWNRAAANWDVDQLTALYTKDALFYGGRPGHSVGTAAIRSYFASYVGVLAAAPLELIDQTIIRLAAGIHLAQGYGHFRFKRSDGSRSEAVLRTTLVLVRGGEGWLIQQHHFSATPASPPI